ncbi:MAG TPA: ABC transporter permease subunit [Candidatus Limnocylindria bacterium]|nr:ABC transporter permease subunit [Candidatus Limnocylindria bacterium]
MLAKRMRVALKRDWQLYLFLLLPVAYVVIFHYVPMAGLQLAFRRYTPRGGIWGSPWVGLANLEKFVASYQFERVVSNTLILSVYGLTCMQVIPILFALILNSVELPRFRKITQTVVNLPHFISVVVLVGMLMQVFNSRTGIYGILWEAATGAYPSDLLGKLGTFRHLYIWSTVWQNFGWQSIIYTAALAGVDAQLHEAAQIDGASRVQRIVHVDLPYIMPTIMILLIMGIGNIMSVGFEKAYLMQNSLNLQHSELISTYVYRIGLSGIGRTDFSYATAIGFFNAVINLALILMANAFSRRVAKTSLF